jgi:hypothetical protein
MAFPDAFSAHVAQRDREKEGRATAKKSNEPYISESGPPKVDRAIKTSTLDFYQGVMELQDMVEAFREE